MSLRLAFMGTPDFAVPALAALIEAGHGIARVYSQPPRPAGRGQRERPSPVAAFAEARGIEVATPKSLRTAEARSAFAALGLDAAVVAAYGLILPKAILDAPRLGCFNIHASLLPRWRGAAPIQRAILAGDAETGVTIMKMDEGLDTGAMLAAETVPIGPTTNTGALHDVLAALGARLIVAALGEVEAGRAVARPQPAEGVTYAAKIDKGEAQIDWSCPAVELERRVRAFAPVPGVWFARGEDRIRILAATVEPGQGAPGTVLDDRLLIACGAGALRPVTVQKAGGKPMDLDAFLRGHALPKGAVLS